MSDVVGQAVGEWRVEGEVLIVDRTMHRSSCELATDGTRMWAGCTIVSVDAPRLCETCRPEVVEVRDGSACKECGLPLIDEEKGLCRHCA